MAVIYRASGLSGIVIWFSVLLAVPHGLLLSLFRKCLPRHRARHEDNSDRRGNLIDSMAGAADLTSLVLVWYQALDDYDSNEQDDLDLHLYRLRNDLEH